MIASLSFHMAKGNRKWFLLIAVVAILIIVSLWSFLEKPSEVGGETVTIDDKISYIDY